jgi:hypothetical protein
MQDIIYLPLRYYSLSLTSDEVRNVIPSSVIQRCTSQQLPPTHEQNLLILSDNARHEEAQLAGHRSQFPRRLAISDPCRPSQSMSNSSMTHMQTIRQPATELANYDPGNRHLTGPSLMTIIMPRNLVIVSDWCPLRH